MLFSEPVPFEEAIQSLKAKSLLPTRLSSEQLSELDAGLRRRSMFSARVYNAQILQEFKDTLTDIMTPGVEPREEGKQANVGLDLPQARIKLNEFLDSISYQAPRGKAGTIEDLSSDQRLRLILDTQLKMAHGFGSWQQGQDPEILDVWPAQEFFRAEERHEPRDWPERWAAAGGEFFDGGGDYPEGRMIALKNDPIWTEISEFDTPYPPFDYNSGMDLRDISREEAEEIGLITPEMTIPSERRDFSEDIASAAAGLLDPNIREALLKTLGDGYKIVKGVLQIA